MLNNYEILDLIYKDIQELIDIISLPTKDLDRSLKIQSRIEYLFSLVDRIKQKGTVK